MYSEWYKQANGTPESRDIYKSYNNLTTKLKKNYYYSESLSSDIFLIISQIYALCPITPQLL